MAKEVKEKERRVSPALLIVPVIGVLGLAAVAAFAWAAPPTPPPEGYKCPYCPATFDTYEELATHVQSEHPGERIPLPIEWE